jgi:hypothetical protein
MVYMVVYNLILRQSGLRDRIGILLLLVWNTIEQSICSVRCSPMMSPTAAVITSGVNRWPFYLSMNNDQDSKWKGGHILLLQQPLLS